MRWKGYMSVFFSLSLLCICALLCTLAETARMAGARCYWQMAVNSSLDSVFSQYHRELWEEYRLLFVEYRSGEEAAADFETFLKPYLEAESWYPLVPESIVAEQFFSATDAGGAYLEQEILDYMKYGIWKMDFQAEEMESLVKGGTEAAAVREIAGSYRGDTKGAWRLEEALEQIQGSLTEQQKLLGTAGQRLEDYDGSGFCKTADLLILQLERIPSLIRTYERQADRLAQTLAVSRQQQLEMGADLSEGMRQGLEDEFREYESYVDKDGERRQEIAALEAWSKLQIQIVADAVEEAREVMAILADWDDEEEEPDLDELWGRVKIRINRFERRDLSVSHGIQDKEKQSWLEQAETFFQLNVLALVLPEGTEVSRQIIKTDDLPSVTETGGGYPGTGGLGDRLLITEYCSRFFVDYRDELSETRPLQYELEYLFAGSSSDTDNLSKTVGRILLLREGWNLMHILGDSAKRAQARELAMTIVGATGIAPLVLVTAFFIMSIWALGESIMDLRLLLGGKRVPLLKGAEDWQLSLEGLLQIGQGSDLPGEETEGNGLNYEAYVKFLLFFKDRTELYYRIMDVIQVNLCQKQDSFRMKYAGYRIDIQATARSYHVFLLPGITGSYGTGAAGGYLIQAGTQKAY